MPRSTPRATLKLPAQPARQPTATRGADGERLPARKPIRGGMKVKQSASEKASALAARAERFAPRANDAVERARERPETGPERERLRSDDGRPRAVSAPAATGRDAAPLAPQPAPPPGERPALPAKLYPKRGIARSTGARALPPMRPADAERASEARPTTLVAAKLLPGPEPTVARPAREIKTVRRAPNEPPRLSKRIAEMTSCSRREADEWIENGWISVDGVVVTTLGVRVHPQAAITIKEEASRHQTESVTILFNKPAEISDAPEAGGPIEAIGAHNRWAEDDTRLAFKATHLRGLAQAGKLDAEASGMLVFTQEGSVARRINGDDTRLEKEYLVRVEGELTPEGLKLLNHGLTLDEVKLKRAQVSWQSEQQLRVVLHESRRQQISRMCELVGLRVTSIKRIRIGSVSLGKLPAGQWRYLRENERF